MSVSNADIAKMIEEASNLRYWPKFLDSGFDTESGNWVVWLAGEFKYHKITIESVKQPTRDEPVELF